MAQDDPFGTNRPDGASAGGLVPLAEEVISVLCERQTVTPAGARQIALDYLVRAVTSPAGFDAVLVAAEMSSFRLTHDALIDLYIPEAARQLGAMWMTSDMDFAGVTVGALRLQALLGEVSGGLTRVRGETSVLHALVIVPEAEQHFLGASVVAAQLRRLGCDVSLSVCEAPRQIIGRVLHDQPDMVLFSIARAAALETVIRTVKKIKTSGETTPVLAIGGALRGHADGLRDQTGVDLVTNSAQDVVSFCAKRLKAVGRG